MMPPFSHSGTTAVVDVYQCELIHTHVLLLSIQVYWNSRLQTEHGRIASLIPKGAVVCTSSLPFPVYPLPIVTFLVFISNSCDHSLKPPDTFALQFSPSALISSLPHTPLSFLLLPLLIAKSHQLQLELQPVS